MVRNEYRVGYYEAAKAQNKYLMARRVLAKGADSRHLAETLLRALSNARRRVSVRIRHGREPLGFLNGKPVDMTGIDPSRESVAYAIR